MSRLVLPQKLLEDLRSELFHGPDESAAILFANLVSLDGRVVRVIANEAVYFDDDAYTVRSPIAAQLRPEVVASVTKRAARSGLSLVFVHTHPFPMNKFSVIDDEGERVLAEFTQSRMPGSVHAAMLLTPEVAIARQLGTQNYLEVAGIGESIAWGAPVVGDAPGEQFDRQVRAFGAEGQKRLGKIRVAMVGVGGTGSVALQQLVHLGVRDFVLLDPDVIEDTNLNRVVGAAAKDIGRRKVDVAGEMALRISGDCILECRCESVLLNSVARSLADVDLIFACTDSHGSRAVLNQLAYQYLIPTIDMGVVIVAKDGKIENITGRVQYLAPEMPCLQCRNVLNPEEVRRDLLNEFERQKDPYITGGEPAPSVITLNSVVSSLATTMFLDVACGTPGQARLINFDAINGKIRSAAGTRIDSCIDCSSDGVFAAGDTEKLRGRNDYPPMNQ